MTELELISSFGNFEIDLMPDNKVRITLSYQTPYEAAVVYDDISSGAKTGDLRLRFQLGKILRES